MCRGREEEYLHEREASKGLVCHQWLVSAYVSFVFFRFLNSLLRIFFGELSVAVLMLSVIIISKGLILSIR